MAWRVSFSTGGRHGFGGGHCGYNQGSYGYNRYYGNNQPSWGVGGRIDRDGDARITGGHLYIPLNRNNSYSRDDSYRDRRAERDDDEPRRKGFFGRVSDTIRHAREGTLGQHKHDEEYAALFPGENVRRTVAVDGRRVPIPRDDDARYAGGKNTGRDRGVSNQRTVDFFPQKAVFFAEQGQATLNLIGRNDSIYAATPANRAFVDGYKTTLGQYRGLNSPIEVQARREGKEYPQAAIDRQELAESIFAASMKHAAANPSEYPSNTFLAGKQYGEQKIGFGLENVKDKATIEKLQLAFGAAAKSDAKITELAKILEAGHGEKTLAYNLDNFNNPKRAAAFSKLTPEQQASYKELAGMDFTKNPDAYNTQQSFLTNADVWNGTNGVVTDLDPQRFSIVIDGGVYSLRVVNGEEKKDISIPQNKLEETFALIGKLSLADTKADVNFAASAAQIQALLPDAKIGEFSEVIGAGVKAEKTAQPKKTAAVPAAAATVAAAAAPAAAVEQELLKPHTDAVAKAEEQKKQAEEGLKTAHADISKAEARIGAVVKKLGPNETELRKASSFFGRLNFAYDLPALQAENATLIKERDSAKADLGQANTQLAAKTTALEEANKQLARVEADFNKNPIAAAQSTPVPVPAEQPEQPTVAVEQPNPEAFADKVVANLKAIGLDNPDDVAEAKNTATEAAKKILASNDPSERAEIIKSMLSELRTKAEDAGRNAEVFGVKMGDTGASIAANKVNGILPALQQAARDELKLPDDIVKLIAQQNLAPRSPTALYVEGGTRIVT